MSIKRLKKKLNSKSTNIQKLVAVKLNNFCKYLDGEYDINSGGCCYIAYLLAQLLKKDGFKFKVVVWDSSFDDKCNDFNNLLKSHNHYGLLLNGCFINEAGYHNDSYYIEKIFSNVKIKDIINHYNNSSWNSFYDKSKNPFISKMLKVYYESLTQDLREE